MSRSVRAHSRALSGGAVLLVVALLASGCAERPPPRHADAAARAACGQHADAVFRKRNPDVIYREDTYATSTRDAPFTGAGLSSIPSAGLSGRYERAVLLDDCLNGGGGPAGSTPDTPTPGAAPTRSSVAPPPPQP